MSSNSKKSEVKSNDKVLVRFKKNCFFKKVHYVAGKQYELDEKDVEKLKELKLIK